MKKNYKLQSEMIKANKILDDIYWLIDDKLEESNYKISPAEMGNIRKEIDKGVAKYLTTVNYHHKISLRERTSLIVRLIEFNIKNESQLELQEIEDDIVRLLY